MPLAMHNFSQGESRVVRSRFEIFATAPADVQYCICSLIFNDVFERFPKLKILSVENDVGWAANYLQRLDHCFGRYSVLLNKKFKSGRLPSEQFRDHVWLTFMDDMAAVRTYDLVGVDKVMWANDYPHGDSSYPASPQMVEAQVGDLPQDHQDRILRTNVLDLYHWH